MKKAIVVAAFLILSSAAVFGEESLIDQIEFTGSFSPQLHADGFGIPLEGGLLLPVRLFEDFRLYGAATAGLQWVNTGIHGELSLLLNLKAWGEFWSHELDRENIVAGICGLFGIEDLGKCRVGAAASLGGGGGLMNYWLKANLGYKAMGVAYIRPGVGLFLDSDLFMMNVDLGYQIDFAGTSVRTFLIIPISITVHGPAFPGDAG